MAAISTKTLGNIPPAKRRVLAKTGVLADILKSDKESSPTEKAMASMNYFPNALTGQNFTPIPDSFTRKYNRGTGSGPGGSHYSREVKSILEQELPEFKSWFDKKNKGQPGIYRPVRTLDPDDLNDEVLRVIAGEARMNDPDSVNAVINNMFNRLGADGFGPSKTLLEVATAPGQYEAHWKGGRVLSDAERVYLTERIKSIASGSEPDITNGATSYRASSYVFGAGSGLTFARQAAKQGNINIGGNVYVKDAGFVGPYAAYDEPRIAIRTDEPTAKQWLERPENAGKTEDDYNIMRLTDKKLSDDEKTATQTALFERLTSAGVSAKKIATLQKMMDSNLTWAQVEKYAEIDITPALKKDRLTNSGGSVPSDKEGLIEWWSKRSPRTDIEKIAKVDPVLLKSYAEGALQYESNHPQERVEFFGPASASRTSGSTANHGIKNDGFGKAGDFVITKIDTGEQIANLGKHGYEGQVGGSTEGSEKYTELHGHAEIAREYFHPESESIRQGGGFATGSTAGDWMHGDITGGPMGGYSWEEGYTDAQKKRFGIEKDFKLGDKKRIQELGQQIYGKKDAQGKYVNVGKLVNAGNGMRTIASSEISPASAVAPAQSPGPIAQVSPATVAAKPTTRAVTTGIEKPADRTQPPAASTVVAEKPPAASTPEPETAPQNNPPAPDQGIITQTSPDTAPPGFGPFSGEDLGYGLDPSMILGATDGSKEYGNALLDQ
jgi:hypothetical protein